MTSIGWVRSQPRRSGTTISITTSSVKNASHVPQLRTSPIVVHGSLEADS